MDLLIEELRIAMFCSGVGTIEGLRSSGVLLDTVAGASGVLAPLRALWV